MHRKIPDENEAEPTTTAKVVCSLDVILFEIGHIDNVLQDAPRAQMNEATLREVRRRVSLLFDGADQLMTFLSEVTLETVAN